MRPCATLSKIAQRESFHRGHTADGFLRQSWVMMPSGYAAQSGYTMITDAPPSPPLFVAAKPALPAVVPDTGFDARWNAWVQRGVVHDRKVRRRSTIWACVAAVSGTIVYLWFR